MQFIKTGDWKTGVSALTKRLHEELQAGKRVLWLVCGGSNIPAEAAIMAALPEEATKNLAIFLTDERFGEVGHIHSNAKQLADAGFTPKQAVFMPLLTPGFTLEETQGRYQAAIQRAVDHADVIIAEFGIGPDGHIAGILPHSEAVKANGWVAAYEAPHYTRVTLTFEALRHITAAYAFVFGKEKHEALQQLQTQDLDLADQPSQILKQLPEAYVYNDQIGE